MIVTTNVPGRQEAMVGPATNPARTDRADELLERLAALETTLSLIRDARDFRVLKQRAVLGRRREPGSYLALTAEVKRLQRVAQAAREAEASQAISWIKRAIETYALTRDDLGI